MTLTLMSLFCASKSGSNCRNASLRLLAAAIVRVSGAACTDGAVQTVVVSTPMNNKLFTSKCRPVITYLLVMGMTFIIDLEIELLLHINSVFDEIATESWLSFEREPVRCTSAASHCEVSVVDDEPIIVSTVEAIVDGGAELLGQVVFLFCGRIQHPISNGKLEPPRNDVLADLDIPAPGLAEIHRWACDRRWWNSV